MSARAEEVEQQLKILNEKTKSLFGQFEIVCLLILDRLQEIENAQEYLLWKTRIINNDVELP